MKLDKKTKILICLNVAIIAVVLIADLISKHFTTGYDTAKSIIPYIINFKSSQNTGAAWSIFSGSTIALIIITFVAIALIIFYAIWSKNKSYFFNISISLILSGAIGNLIDRLIFGYVRDFIQFDFWKSFPIFNLADAALTIGVVCLCIYYLIQIIKEYKNKKNKDKNDDKNNKINIEK